VADIDLSVAEQGSDYRQAPLRRRILRAFVGPGLLESFEAKEMLAYQHSEPREARIYSARFVITWLGRSTALVFLQIFPIFAAKTAL